jgi:hypothetical protein
VLSSGWHWSLLCQVTPGTAASSCDFKGNISQTRAIDAAAGLPGAQQRLALEPAARGTRKVVVATNIAETSLTIEVRKFTQQ